MATYKVTQIDTVATIFMVEADSKEEAEEIVLTEEVEAEESDVVDRVFEFEAINEKEGAEDV